MRFPKIFSGAEWTDLKRFESLSDVDRSIVFYAENKASMNHFRTLIRELTEGLNLQICLVTSVRDDPMLSSTNKNILSFYIGDGSARTTFFLTARARTIVMDMPDLDRYYIKRSKAFPVHYIYLFHSMFSMHSYLRKGSLDHYDTIFCVGPHHVDEIRATEHVYKLKPKTLINYGYGRLDMLLEEKELLETKGQSADPAVEDLVLITPSYGSDNLLERCGHDLIDSLLRSQFKVLVRPHFKTLRGSAKLIRSLKGHFGKNPDFLFHDGVIPAQYFHSSRCLISDWSGISMEYAFTVGRSVIFIDVPKKVLNPHASDVALTPIEVSIRDRIGHVVLPADVTTIPDIVRGLSTNRERVDTRIREIRRKTVFNIGTSQTIGAEYIQRLVGART